MTGLQEVFYIVAIVYMGLSLLIIAAVLTALLVIRHKIVSLERMVREKVDAVASVGVRAGEVISTVKRFARRAAK